MRGSARSLQRKPAPRTRSTPPRREHAARAEVGRWPKRGGRAGESGVKSGARARGKGEIPYFPPRTCASHILRSAPAHLAAAPASHPPPPAARQQPDIKTTRKLPGGRRPGISWAWPLRERRPLGAGRYAQPSARAPDWLRCLRGARKRPHPARPLLLFSQLLCPHRLVREPLRCYHTQLSEDDRTEGGGRRTRSLPHAPGLPPPARRPGGGAAAGTPRLRPGKTTPATSPAGHRPLRRRRPAPDPPPAAWQSPAPEGRAAPRPPPLCWPLPPGPARMSAPP